MQEGGGCKPCVLCPGKGHWDNAIPLTRSAVWLIKRLHHYNCIRCFLGFIPESGRLWRLNLMKLPVEFSSVHNLIIKIGKLTLLPFHFQTPFKFCHVAQ